MSTEELLNIRFKLIAGYPGCEIPVGSIIDMRSSYVGSVGIDTLNNYPHLFQKLEWWQERAESDLPEYIQYVRDGKKLACYKIHGWNIENAYAICERGEDYPLYLQKHTVPATLEEYNQYQSLC